MIVKNEDMFIWYAVSSVLPFIDKFLIFDTGSTDKTGKIIELFRDKKIVFEQKGEVDPKKMTQLRQEQIEKTNTDWMWIVDGDEVYPEKTAKKTRQVIEKNKSLYGVIVHRYDLLGDIYHSQDERVGIYDQFGKKGHYVLRLINKKRIKGLKVLGDYPNEYFVGQNGNSIKKHGKDKFAFVEERIFHAMYLKRSTETGNIYRILNRERPKIEIGREIPRKELPEVFFQKKPAIVPEVTQEMDFKYKLLASVITPVKKLKRKILKSV